MAKAVKIATAPDRQISNRAPLADELRPTTWADFSGAEVLDQNLLKLVTKGAGRPPSLVLWGPPGCGKTTLARLIGQAYKCKFIELSAVQCGLKEVREVLEDAAQSESPVILFLDEIHRFNKAQQDAFLPAVERGEVSLIGATTENPSFYLNSALSSRMKVVVLPALSSQALEIIFRRGAEHLGLEFDSPAIQFFIRTSGGDARKLLNLLEGFALCTELRRISEKDVREFLESSKVLVYDRDGEEHYNMASAFIKSMRGSDPDAALYWGFRMIEAGEDPRFIIRRMMIFASEDIGNADPRALQLAVATSEAFERLGLPEGRIPVAHCITYLASAPKSNRSYLAMHKAVDAIRENPNTPVPIHLRNAPTGLMKNLGYGARYQYPHDYQAGHVAGEKYLPKELEGSIFYEPSEHGLEKAIGEKFARLRRN